VTLRTLRHFVKVLAKNQRVRIRGVGQMNGSDISAADEGLLGGIDRHAVLLALGTFAIGIPAVVMIPGMDSLKEASVTLYGDDRSAAPRSEDQHSANKSARRESFRRGRHLDERRNGSQGVQCRPTPESVTQGASPRAPRPHLQTTISTVTPESRRPSQGMR
jgi:hypothetical protein